MRTLPRPICQSETSSVEAASSFGALVLVTAPARGYCFVGGIRDTEETLCALIETVGDLVDSLGRGVGCQIGLELAARHPEQVRTLIAHEPPAPALLADPARERATMAEIVQTFRTAGIGPAMQKFMVQTRIRGGPPPPPPGEPTPEMREAMAQFQRNMEFWLGRYFLAIAAYEPDFDALKAGPSRIVPAVGDASRGELAHDGGLRLAARLGTEAVVFPGAHGGFESHAPEFAVKLREVLQD